MSENFRKVLAAGAGLAALFAAATASADCSGCRAPQGLLDYLFAPSASCSPCAAPVAQPVVEAPVVETPCGPCRPVRVYQGDYMVQQRATYSGPAVIAPQPTYAPTPTASGYPYVSGQYDNAAEPYPEQQADNSYQAPPQVERVTRVHRVVRRAPVKRHMPARRTVNVRNDLPATKATQVIRARAEVRIYGSKRMDIRLYRN